MRDRLPVTAQSTGNIIPWILDVLKLFSSFGGTDFVFKRPHGDLTLAAMWLQCYTIYIPGLGCINKYFKIGVQGSLIRKRKVSNCCLKLLKKLFFTI